MRQNMKQEVNSAPSNVAETDTKLSSNHDGHEITIKNFFTSR